MVTTTLDIAKILSKVIDDHGPKLPDNIRVAVFVFEDDGIEVTSSFISMLSEDELRRLLVGFMNERSAEQTVN